MHGIAIERGGDVSDVELEQLLTRVYVDGGFTEKAMATSLFAAAAVRTRGVLVIAREPPARADLDRAPRALLGMVIVVEPGSPVRRLAASDEAEMHLLAVAPAARGRGVGRLLVDEALQIAREQGRARMVLWTQPTMRDAQRLYLAAGFTRAPERDWRRDDREFLVFTRRC